MKKIRVKLLTIGLFIIFWGVYLSIPDGKLRLIFCDVGQGDGAILVKGSWQMLVDTGADNGKMERCLDKYVPFWDKKIEGVIISHWDKDHYGALKKIVNGYKVDHLYESTPSGEYFEGDIPSEVLGSGDRISFGKISFEVISPNQYGESRNDNSLVTLLNYNEKGFLFTGDMDIKTEGEVMTWWKGKAEGIKVSHHGSDTGSSGDWLKSIGVGVAVISVGKNNTYGHPKEVVLNKLSDLGIKTFRTDRDGDVILTWD